MNIFINSINMVIHKYYITLQFKKNLLIIFIQYKLLNQFQMFRHKYIEIKH